MLPWQHGNTPKAPTAGDETTTQTTQATYPAGVPQLRFYRAKLAPTGYVDFDAADERDARAVMAQRWRPEQLLSLFEMTGPPEAQSQRRVWTNYVLLETHSQRA